MGLLSVATAEPKGELAVPGIRSSQKRVIFTFLGLSLAVSVSLPLSLSPSLCLSLSLSLSPHPIPLRPSTPRPPLLPTPSSPTSCAYHLCPKCTISQSLMANPQASTYTLSAATAAEDLLDMFDVVLIDGDSLAKLMRKVRATVCCKCCGRCVLCVVCRVFDLEVRVATRGLCTISDHCRGSTELDCDSSGRACSPGHSPWLCGGGGQRGGLRRWRERWNSVRGGRG